ncbi:LacI family DNA-binding transcriptional regulator [Sphingomonas sp. 1P06PA]|uniref:LacI family DNA-binding transcriptional regulator n=1 Tax=Sphingomonas sp. 1P06PA TaxID=554121 RepID=UPI0039A4586F
MPNRSTIRDVSDRAGVSIKTVSRVINKERYVRDATRLKVEAAMAALDFRPSAAARALAGAKSWQVAVLYDNPSPYYVFHLLAGVREGCRERGFRLIPHECDAFDPALVDEIRALFFETHIDGLILSPPVGENRPLLAELSRRKLPFVRIAPGITDTAASVSIDDAAGAEAMTAHLIALGHRRIGFVSGHPGHPASAERAAGHARALAVAGITPDPALMRPGRFDFASGRAAGAQLLDLAVPPTAIFAANDDMAAGVMAIAHERGLAVPGDVSIAGFDDTDLAGMLWPPLTSVHQPTRELGHAAAGLLLDAAAGHRLLDHQLIVRGSTAPPSVQG